MGKHPNPVLIGGFVIGAMILIVAAILVFGSGSFFSERVQYVLYFERSVKGLQIGAPVDFRGVKIGTVTDIRVYFDTKGRTFRIPVYIELEPNRLTQVCCQDESRMVPKETDPAMMIRELVSWGLRARVEQESLVTGLLYVQLDFFPDTSINLVGIDEKVIELPTIPSSLQQISETFEKLPLETLVTKVIRAVEGVDRLVNSAELADSIQSLNLLLKTLKGLAVNIESQVAPLTADVHATLTEVQTLARNINADAAPMLAGLDNASRDAQKAVVQAQAVFARIDAMVADQSPLRFEVDNTLSELSAAARAIRQMADYFKRHPESLIYGRPKAKLSR